MSLKRASGIILHISSLPSLGGIGDFGPAAYAFADFLRDARQGIWQVLPLGPTAWGNSPYASTSAFAGNPLLISLEKLVEAGTLTSVPLKDFVAAVSVGIVDGEILLDLCYEEDSRADVDMNFVMTAGHKMVEVQATAERQAFDEAQFAKMMAYARQGVQSLIAKQQGVLSGLTLRQ